MEEKLKIDLSEAEAKIMKTNEVGFNKALLQVKYFSKMLTLPFLMLTRMLLVK